MRKILYLIMTDQIEGKWVSIFKRILYLSSLFYGALVKLSYWCYQERLCPQYELGKPVVSVGNITWGGVGKTPFVELIAKLVKEQNRLPAILIRGYKGKKKDPTALNIESDEALSYQTSLKGVPIGIGKDRFQKSEEILQNSPVDVFLLDDGFQHWRIKRNLNIVLIDATNPFGNGFLIPRGILREPLSAVSRADLIVITKSDIGKDNIAHIKDALSRFKNIPILESIHRPEYLWDLRGNSIVDLSFIRDKPICSFCSIGDPESFERTLVSLGVQLTKNFVFMDHHWYSHQDISQIIKFCSTQGIDTLVTTNKDAVKLKEFENLWDNNLKIFALKIQIQIIHGKDELFNRILRLL